MARVKVLSSLAFVAAPFVAIKVYTVQQRRNAKKQLLEALKSGDSQAICLACTCAEDVGVDAALIAEGRTAAKRLAAEAALLEVLPQGSPATEDIAAGGHGASALSGEELAVTQAVAAALPRPVEILRACEEAERAGVDSATVEQGRGEARRLLLEELCCGDDARILRACAYAAKAGLDSSKVEEARTQARDLAKVALAQAMEKGDASSISRACARAETAGVASSKVSRARTEAQRLRAEAELREAMRSGVRGGASAQRLEHAVQRAREAGVDAAALAEGSAEAKRLRAGAALLEALQGGKVRHLEVACARAQAAGVDAATLAEGRLVLARAREDAGRRLAEAETELRVALEDPDCGAERLYRACRRAEEAGADEEKIQRARGEARRRFDQAELKQAMQTGDLARAYMASGGQPNLPLEL